MNNWFYSKNGSVSGPYGDEEIKSLASSGTFGKDDFVLKQGFGGWNLAGSMSEFLDFSSEKNNASSSDKAPPDEALPLNEQAERDLGLGVEGYRIFQSRLANNVSPDEANSAELAYTKRIRWFWLFVLGITISYAGKYLLESLETSAFLQGYDFPYAIPLYAQDLIASSTLIGILFFVNWLRVSYAGRILFPLQINFSVYSDLALDMTGDDYGLLLILGFLVGWFLDWNCNLKKKNSFLLPRRLCLSLFSGLLAAFAVEHSRSNQALGYWPFLIILTAILLFAFTWIPKSAPRVFRLGSSNAETLMDASIKRWGRMILGRALAMLLCSYPLFLLLNNLGMDERFSQKDQGDLSVELNGTQYLIYDFLSPGLLKTQDLNRDDRKFYWFEPDRIPKKNRSELLELISSRCNTNHLETHPVGELSRLEELLSPYQIKEGEEFCQAIQKWSHQLGQGDLIEIENLAFQDSYPFKIQAAYYPLHPDSGNNFRIGWYSTYFINTIANQSFYLNWGTVIFCLIPIVLLWRRGGESEGARWAGIWLSVLAVQVASLHMWLHSQSFSDRAMKLPFKSAFADLVQIPYFTLKDLGGIQYQLGTWFLPIAFLWTHFCWPNKSPIFNPWKLRFLNALKSLLVAGLFFCIHDLFNSLSTSTVNNHIVWVMQWLGLTLLMLVVGMTIRNRRSTLAPALGVMPTAAFFCAIGGWLLLGLAIRDAGTNSGETISNVHLLGIPALLFLGAFLALSSFVMLRRDFLHMSGTNGALYLALAILLPALIEVSQWVSVKVMTGLALSTVRGAEIFGIAIAVFVLVPMERYLHRLLTRMSVRKLSQIEERVSEAVESICEVNDSEERQKHIEEALNGFGITSFSLFFRQKPDRFVLYSCSDDSSTVAVKEITLSNHILNALRNHDGFIDLKLVCRDRDFFFHQFELFRIEKKLNCRFIMPIKLGKSLRGLLLLPKSGNHDKITRTPMAVQLSNFGVAAFDRPTD